MHFENLDQTTRHYMFEEAEQDIQAGTLYVSARLTLLGRQEYPNLLVQAVTEHDDAWLSTELRRNGHMAQHEKRKRPKTGGFSQVKVPVTAADTLSEGEFNRYYVRGLCRRAIDEDIAHVEVYRGKSVTNPRPQSELMLGHRISPKELLEDLRQSAGVEPALGLPPGPNSGLTVRLAA